MSKKRFTLIELLVVIAIIAILASMLLPALGRARELAKLNLCISNLKQFSICYLNYLDDSKGFIPFCNTGQPTWKYQMRDYIAGYKYGTMSGGSKKAKILTCPKVGRTPSNSPDSGDYVLNSYAGVFTNLVPNPVWAHYANRKAANNKRSSETFMAHEYIGNYQLGYGQESLMNTTNSDKCFRHDGRLAASYLDGHASVLKENDFQVSDLRKIPWRSDTTYSTTP